MFRKQVNVVLVCMVTVMLLIGLCSMALAVNAVTRFTAVGDNGQVKLSWQNPPDYNFHSTVIVCRTDRYPDNYADGTVLYWSDSSAKGPGSWDSYTHTGCTNGTTYYYAAFSYAFNGTWGARVKTAAQAGWDTLGDTWSIKDALGRTVSGNSTTGDPEVNKTVGLFYYLWHGQHSNMTGTPYNNTNILAANPYNPQWGPQYAWHHWGEPELGYYVSTDHYVIRRHCQMLVDAGVDFIVFDATNGISYTDSWFQVCTVYAQIRSEGGKTPQICFFCQPGRTPSLDAARDAVVNEVYNIMYSQNYWSDLWFYWQDKPLILAPYDSNDPDAIKNFFTFRSCNAISAGQDYWTFLDNYPQNYAWHTFGVPEEVSVCTAQIAPWNYGRSFHNGSQPTIDQYGLCPTTAQGLCFAEQWNGALTIDPQIIFITQWNEWVGFRFIYPDAAEPSQYFLGHHLVNGETYFVDEYNQEFSRDIEPMKGGHTDNYYYQTMDGIRRYKGARAEPAASPAKTISIDGSFSDWDNVYPEYRDTKGDTEHRDHAGWGSVGTYVNNAGRNDIIKSKVALDYNYVYFYAETAADLTTYNAYVWMTLLLDTDKNRSTGWLGYDYMLWGPSSSTTTTLWCNYGTNWNYWGTVGDVSYRAAGNKLEVRIPRSYISVGSATDFEFHWMDNAISGPPSEMSLFDEGDNAPNRRANYHYSGYWETVAPNAVRKLAVNATSATQNVLTWTNPDDADFYNTRITWRTDRFPTSATDVLPGNYYDTLGGAGSAGNWTHSGLTAGVTYYYAAFPCDWSWNWGPGVTQKKQSPYSGTPISIPGKIEAENYDWGGEGISYHDNDPQNIGYLQNGYNFRGNEGVDVEATSDAGGGADVGWMNAGEWLEYTINVTSSGYYDIKPRVASGDTNIYGRVEIDGVDVTGTIGCFITYGWQNWSDTLCPSVYLTAGQHVLKYCALWNQNLNYIQIDATTRTPYAGVYNVPCTIQAEDYCNGGQGVGYSDYDVSNRGGAYRTDQRVDIEGCAEGGYNNCYTTNGEWLTYIVNIPTEATYRIRARVSGYCNGRYSIAIGGSGGWELTFPATGGWQNWTTHETLLYLMPGRQVLTFRALSGIDGHFLDNDGVWNLNYIEIAPY